jgi:YjbE family integral membrane protein
VNNGLLRKKEWKMEILSSEFLSALLAIVVIDLVLAGDNAIVIALAARNLPEKLRNRAIVWGTAGAIFVRSALTLVVVWLLNIPGLMLAGGAMLLWIAYKLLIQPDDGEGHQVNSGSTFWAAIKTIVIADAVMGLDNVLGVAGAAHGNFTLVVLGLLISIPIMIAGSQIILKYVQKYPVIVYIGAGVLVWTAVKMMTSEPLIKDTMDLMGNYVAMLYAVAMGGVLGAGLWANHGKARSRVAAHVVDLAAVPATPIRATTINPNGENIMNKVLIPVDGTASALQAVQHVVNRFLVDGNIEVHLLHVRAPFSQHISRFVSKRNRSSYHRELAAKALESARNLLDRHSIPHASHIELGEAALVIDRVAQRLDVDQIVMGTARKSTLTRLVQDSVTSKVLETTQVPVEVVAGAPASWWERIGVPASVGTAMAALFLAVVD